MKNYNIISINPNNHNSEIIVENMVKNKDKALDYWNTMGMTNVTYKAVKAIPFDNAKVNRIKTSGHLHKTNCEPLKINKNV